MRETLDVKLPSRSRLVADAIREILADLRLIDADDLIAYIKASQWANINDLVQSSTELFFEDGAVTFACAGAFEMSWCTPPLVSLDMEFQRDDITVFFTIKLGAWESTVVVRDVWFASPPIDEATGTSALAAALRSARKVAADRPLPQ